MLAAADNMVQAERGTQQQMTRNAKKKLRQRAKKRGTAAGSCMTSDSESVSVQDVLAENNCIVKEVKEAASPDKSARKRNDDLGSVTEPAVKKPRVEAAVVSKPVSLTSDKKSLSLMDSARNTLARSPLGQRALCAVASAWDKGQSLAAHYVTEYRGIFVVLFLLPISFASDVLWALHHLYVCYLLGAQSPAAHAKRVTKVQEQVMTARKQGQTKMCTARPAWLAMSFREGLYKSKWAKIDLNDFNHVLKVDTNRRIIRCEPLCSMGQLTHALIRKGWTLAVTPELDDLTVGGLIMGFGVETSSHRHGLFQHTVKALEIVLPDGTFKRTTADLNADLFYAVPWSHGTLGFLVAAEIEIVPCQPLVELTYRPCISQEEYTQVFTQASDDSKTYDFVEGLVYSKDEAVIMTGKMKPYSALLKKPFTFNPIGHWWKPWFYLHVKSFLGKPGISDIPDSQVPTEYTELLPLRDYYHRHTRSIFWELKDIIPFSDHWLFRLLLGWMTPPRISIIKLGQTDAIREAFGSKHVAQDMLVPMSTLTESMNCMDQEFSTYPLWLCPMLLPAMPANSPGARALVRSRLPHDGNMLPEQMFVDIGAYGAPPIPNFDARHALRQAERFVLHEAQGYQALYADSLLTRQEFRQMFDHSLYDEVRAKYNMDESFPEIYDKVSLSARK